MKLPEEFLNKMKALLGEKEFEDFLKSYDEPRNYGLRINTLKISVEEFLKISPFELETIPWTKDGFYYKEGENPGKHPYYHAGLYYIQEPSAMFPATVIDAKPGERILDLCAAPGGKTVQIAAGMCGQGLIVANDINSDRVKALVKNIELYGVRNAIVTNETPESLAKSFKGYFDKILVDAPCSGEGMFRKDEDATSSWEKFKYEKCEVMQWDILQKVDEMLRPGGVIVYSTCTFSPEEDEKMISQFIQKNNNYKIIEIQKTAGIDNGIPEWADCNNQLSHTARLWPHKLRGEGHFVAMLRKQDEIICSVKKDNNSMCSGNTTEVNGSFIKFGQRLQSQIVPSIAEDGLQETYRNFIKNNLNIEINGYFRVKGNNLYCLPIEPPDFNGLKVAKFGWYIGEFAYGKFEPSHSLAISIGKEEIRNYLSFSSESREIMSYLKGETLMVEGERGFVGICVDGYTVGWAKQTGDTLKNLYPKGWRKMG